MAVERLVVVAYWVNRGSLMPGSLVVMLQGCYSVVSLKRQLVPEKGLNYSSQFVSADSDSVSVVVSQHSAFSRKTIFFFFSSVWLIVLSCNFFSSLHLRIFPH